ncbi:hypothetical protein Pryu01_00827 [Paraliobacillus ryukyuensis]|uniref:Putative membrane protein YvbJ n=1 Tax=Paraliobacillus ryukyuensis TaxID=200904 RepID=A0A366EFT3_9BACI|nr:zinc-ribbon domain-containing protein [Paraliobacillus ryukyuensis]RBP00600.1 putative membrane protein YvbJ [Paraliobacillus ryukyuensis]
MNHFCKECGHELKSKANFCPECGTSVQQTTQVHRDNTISKESAKQSLVSRIKRLSRKQKVIGSSVIAAIILLIVTYQIGATLTDKDRLINRFEQALADQDAKAMADLLTAGDKRLEITEENLSEFMKYTEETPSSQQYFTEDLRAQASVYESGNTPESSRVFSLKQDGKTALIYDHYTIEVMPFYFEVRTNMKDVHLMLNNEALAVSDAEAYTKEFGPFLPGNYQVSASYENDYAVLENNVQLQLLAPYDQHQQLDLSLYGEYVSLSSEYEDIATSTSFFVNDKAIDLSEDNQFGPVSVDGSIAAHSVLTFPWGEAQSQKTPIESSYMDLAVPSPFSEEIQTEIVNTIHGFAGEYVDATKARDVSLFTTTTDAYNEDATSEYDNMNDWDKRWTGSYDKTVVDVDSFSLFEDDDTFGLEVDAQLHFSDVASYYADDEDVEKSDEVDDLSIEMLYNEEDGAWYVNDYYSLWSFEPENTVERKVKTQ